MHRGKKWHFWTEKEENTLAFSNVWWKWWGCLLCQTPNIFNFYRSWKTLLKKVKKSPQKEVALLLFFSLGLCTLDVLTFQISLTSSQLPQTQLMVGLKEKTPRRGSTGLGVAQGGALLRWLICSQWFGVFLLQKETQWINALWKLESEMFHNRSRVIILP